MTSRTLCAALLLVGCSPGSGSSRDKPEPTDTFTTVPTTGISTSSGMPTTGTTTTTTTTTPPAGPPNLLVFLIDDMGIESLAPYGASNPLTTPNLDQLAADSIQFDTAYASPLCSPTRAELLTGRWSHRYGITHALDPSNASISGLDVSETLVPEALIPVGYSSAVVGKWHLATVVDGPDHPRQSGFEHHHGSLADTDRPQTWLDANTYYDWEKATDGVISRHTTYATTDSADEALALMQTLPEPWFILVAFNAAHGPWTPAPPASLLSGPPPDDTTPIPLRYAAVAEALDTEIGRVLAARDTNTWLFCLGDNGTPQEVIGSRGKATAWETGVRVPLFVSGPGVVPRVEPGLVAVVDLFPTLLDLAGAPLPATDIDGESLHDVITNQGVVTREWVYAGRTSPNYSFGANPIGWHRMIRDDRYKLIDYLVVDEAPVLSMFDLQTDPHELNDLLLQPLDPTHQQAFDDLQALYDAVLAL